MSVTKGSPEEKSKKLTYPAGAAALACVRVKNKRVRGIEPPFLWGDLGVS